MSLGTYLLSQFAHPHGRLGSFVGAFLNRGNRVINQRSLEALEAGAGDRVLEVGFGGGATLAILLAEKGCAYVGGLDPSTEMVLAAGRRFRQAVTEGRLAVRQGRVENIPWADLEFDRVLTVNSLPYWPEPARGFGEMWRVLRPGGTLVLGLRNKAAMDKLKVERLGFWSPSPSEIESLFTAAGFTGFSMQSHRERLKGDFEVFCARKESRT
jgi:SAM-dependent methyltransferase